MNSKWGWHFSRVTRQLWFRATLISLLAVFSALIGYFAAPYIPEDINAKVGADAVDSILTIIASSMLAVTTFSLSTMVAAYAAATSNVTPRATKLMIEDATSQNVLATFVGSFLFSLVAIITLSMGAYGDRGRVVLFVVTLFVVLLIVVTLVRWIDYVRRLGRVGETTEQVENAVSAALRSRRKHPWLGGLPFDANAIAPSAAPVFAAEIGYIQHVSMETLAACADDAGADIHVLVLPGTFIDAKRPLARIESADAAMHERVASAFVIGGERSFDQDPRFGMSVLSEIASRALSPAMNDPGTAIDVLGRAVRILSILDEAIDAEEPTYPRVRVPALELGELFDDIFSPIARDGAGLAEVQIRLQKALAALSRLDDPRFARESLRHSRLALSRAETALTLDDDKTLVRDAATALSRSQPLEAGS